MISHPRLDLAAAKPALPTDRILGPVDFVSILGQEREWAWDKRGSTYTISRT
jgi:hypothetical protein